MKKYCALILISLFFIVGGSQAQDERTPDMEKAMKMVAERQLSAEVVKELEEGLKTKPNDQTAREKLIRHYFIASLTSRSPEIEEKREQHILWLIEHHPESELAGSPEASILPMGSDGDSEGYKRGKQLWLQQVEKHPEDKAIVSHAAHFVGLNDPRTGRELLEKALALDPGDFQSAGSLAQSYEMEGRWGKSPEEKVALMKKALEIRERALDPSPGLMRFYGLDDVAKTAFETGDIAKAERYAREVLQIAQEFKEDWNYGNAVHYGNIVLGRIALRHDDLSLAKQYLLAAGETPGSPQLNSFGPTMVLAKELLEKGERETVLAYLQSCAKFWKMGGDQLQNWMATIRGGGTPDFRMNLH
jgi:hypothetical protein